MKTVSFYIILITLGSLGISLSTSDQAEACQYGRYTKKSIGKCRSYKNWKKLSLRAKKKTPAYRKKRRKKKKKYTPPKNSCHYGAYTLGSARGKCRSKKNWKQLPLSLKRITPAYREKKITIVPTVNPKKITENTANQTSKTEKIKLENRFLTPQTATDENNTTNFSSKTEERKLNNLTSFPQTATSKNTASSFSRREEAKMKNRNQIPQKISDKIDANFSSKTEEAKLENRIQTATIEKEPSPESNITTFQPPLNKTVKEAYILRAEPKKSSKKISTIDYGQEFTVISCGHKEDRCLIKFKGKSGYVPKNSLINPTRFLKGNYILRAKDSKDSGDLGGIPKSEKVELISCGHKEDRCLVKFKGETGYVPQKALQKEPISTFNLLPVCACTASRCRNSSDYGMRLHPISKRWKLHAGEDIAGPSGTPVIAVGAGTVISAGRAGGAGKLIEIKHSNGLVTRYLHLSKIQKGIKPGVKVRAGQIIGKIGSTGYSTGPHLHFEVTRNGAALAPKLFIPGITKSGIKRSCPTQGGASQANGGSIQ